MLRVDSVTVLAERMDSDERVPLRKAIEEAFHQGGIECPLVCVVQNPDDGADVRISADGETLAIPWPPFTERIMEPKDLPDRKWWSVLTALGKASGIGAEGEWSDEVFAVLRGNE